MTTYPVHCFIRMTSTSLGEIPGYAPVEADDPMDAYAPFVHLTQEAMDAELAEDLEASETAYDEDCVCPCTIHADGTIEIDGFAVLTREKVFEAYFGTPSPKAPGP